MKRRQVWILSAGVVVLIPVLALAQTGPTRVRLDKADLGGPTWPMALGQSQPVYATPIQYGQPGYVGTPEIVSHVGEVLGAIDNSDDRNRLAQQWLQFSQKNHRQRPADAGAVAPTATAAIGPAAAAIGPAAGSGATPAPARAASNEARRAACPEPASGAATRTGDQHTSSAHLSAGTSAAVIRITAV